MSTVSPGRSAPIATEPPAPLVVLMRVMTVDEVTRYVDTVPLWLTTTAPGEPGSTGIRTATIVPTTCCTLGPGVYVCDGGTAAAPPLAIVTVDVAAFQFTLAPRAWLTNRSGTMVRPTTSIAGTSMATGRPFTVAWVFPIMSETPVAPRCARTVCVRSSQATVAPICSNTPRNGTSTRPLSICGGTSNPTGWPSTNTCTYGAGTCAPPGSAPAARTTARTIAAPANIVRI